MGAAESAVCNKNLCSTTFLKKHIIKDPSVTNLNPNLTSYKKKTQQCVYKASTNCKGTMKKTELNYLMVSTKKLK